MRPRTLPEGLWKYFFHVGMACRPFIREAS
jgi:hypothetical protein